ncbi:MAG: tRNA guanosine(34) transglycosylase Tgt [Parcubacteria group bacterium]
MPYKLLNQKGRARLGELTTRRGKIQTPCFMPIATKGGVKAVTMEDMSALSPDIILSNTYHLMLRPGEGQITKLGGFHGLSGWQKPLLTDSGGYQVFSLAKKRKMTADGVTFNSHIDGKKYLMSPEDSIRIQMAIGSDIMMVLDECVALPAKRNYVERSVELTRAWAKRCKDYFVSATDQANQRNQLNKPNQLLFGIVQGGLEKDLRIKSAHDLTKIGFDGYAVGGLAVGEEIEQMYSVLDYITDELPSDKPRYLMGVGYPEQIVEAVKRGVDMFDCVIPTREARHGRLFVIEGGWDERDKRDRLNILEGDKDFYKKLNIKAEKYQFDETPINADSQFAELREHSKAYLRHLFVVEDPTAQRLATLNNVEFYLNLMRQIRLELTKG